MHFPLFPPIPTKTHTYISVWLCVVNVDHIRAVIPDMIYAINLTVYTKVRLLVTSCKSLLTDICTGGQSLADGSEQRNSNAFLIIKKNIAIQLPALLARTNIKTLTSKTKGKKSLEKNIYIYIYIYMCVCVCVCVFVCVCACVCIWCVYINMIFLFIWINSYISVNLPIYSL